MLVTCTLTLVMRFCSFRKKNALTDFLLTPFPLTSCGCLQNQTQVATALQVFLHLGSLQSTVEQILQAQKQRLLGDIQSAVDVDALTQPHQQSTDKRGSHSIFVILIPVLHTTILTPLLPVRNSRVLLEESFSTAILSLMMSAGAFSLGRRRQNFPQQCYLCRLHTITCSSNQSVKTDFL